MKNRTKKLLALILAIAIGTIPLSACGGGGDTAQNPEFVYVPTYTALPSEVGENGMNSVTYSNGLLYFTMNVPYDNQGNQLTAAEVEKLNENMQTSTTIEMSSDSMMSSATNINETDVGYTYKTSLYSIKTDGTGFTKLEGYAPISAEGSSSSINSFCVDGNGNIWTVEAVGVQSGDEYKETYYLRQLDATGKEISNIVLNDIISNEQEYFYVSSIICDKAGNVYLCLGESGLAAVDANGQLLFNLTDAGWVNSAVLLADGSVGAIVGGENGNSIKLVDLTAKSWGKTLTAPYDAYNVNPGGGGYDFCYTSNSLLSGYKASTQEAEPILNWINCDVDSDSVRYSMLLDDGSVLAVTSVWNEETSKNDSDIVTLTKTPYSQTEQKTTLTLATMWLDYNLKSRIVNFNKTDPKYRIEIKDYSQYNTEKDYTAGLTKLNTEIISGNIPDMIDASGLPYEQYAAKGLLEDLYTYIDSDAEIKRDAFVPSVLKALENSDGKLYMLAPSFSITSIVGSPSVVGDEMGWTMEELQQLLKEHPEADYPFGQYTDRNQILTYFCTLNMESFMDWETGSCGFNSDEFKSVLTLAKSFPEKMEYSEDNNLNTSELIASGRQLLEFYSAYDFQSQQFYKAMFGGDITYKGIPTEDRAGNLLSTYGSSLAITTSCKDKAGAWSFIRTLYTPEYQESQYQFPVIQSSFDKKLAEAMKEDESTGGMAMGMGDFEVKFGPTTQEEADAIIAMVKSIKHTVTYDESLMNIIKEEASAFFSGEKTVDQVADIIQSRMTIYINEQR